MEMFLNKQNPNRISRKTATLIDPSSCKQSLHSTISTFRQIKTGNQILEQDKTNNLNKTQISKTFSLIPHLRKNRAPFDQLSKPKQNFRQIQCRRHYEQKEFYKSAKQRVMKKRHQKDLMGRTISFSLSKSRKTHSMYEQSAIDLQREQFNRRHQCLRKYQNQCKQMNDTSLNCIISSDLGKLSTQQLIEMKERKQFQKGFIMGLVRTGQLPSNQPGYSEELRDLSSTNLPKTEIPHQIHHPFEKIPSFIEQNDSHILQKYHKLLDTIHDSHQKFPTDSFEAYDKALSYKNCPRRSKKIRSKISISCAQEWR